MLGIEKGSEFLALEWWQYRWLGLHDGNLSIEVPGEDVAVVPARPASDIPSLVSVSHTITGGSIVRDVGFDAGSGVLSGTIETKPGLPLALFGNLPADWELAREAQFHTTASSYGGWQSETVTTAARPRFAVVLRRLGT
jgi:hypothetical protein